MSEQQVDEANTHGHRRAGPFGVGFAIFAAVVMITVGIFQALQGFVAIVHNNYYVVTPHYVFNYDVTGWGWTHLIIGVIVAVAGIFVLGGHLWARIIGIFVAVISAISNFLFIPYYPVWSTLIIALDIVAIWALCVYNRESAETRNGLRAV